MELIRKYPRTRHITGSRLQPGDHDLEDVPIDVLAEKQVVVEEKMDGANCGFHFDAAGIPQLQSRGHYLTGGPRERQFDLFKQWVMTHATGFRDRIGDQYLIYGEWLHAKHCIYYDQLPHFFLEFDICDLKTGEFLDTPQRGELLGRLPIVSVAILHEGGVDYDQLRRLVGPSRFISKRAVESLRLQALDRRLDWERVQKETDLSGFVEGLYLKVEENGRVIDRYKYVRHGFLQAVSDSESHWMDRPFLPNSIRPGVDIYSESPSCGESP